MYVWILRFTSASAFSFFFFFFFFQLHIVDFSAINSDLCTVHESHKLHFLSTFSLKMGPTVLFTHLKFILLQCFQFSVFSFSKISSIQTCLFKFILKILFARLRLIIFLNMSLSLVGNSTSHLQVFFLLNYYSVI